MVARGDLGVELPIEEVPEAQKRLISLAGRASKPAITATQMLATMVKASRPTRAEVTDVANAIFDGTDAVMLSEETAVGEHAVEAVRVMDRVARAAERQLPYGEWLYNRVEEGERDVAETVAQVAVAATYRLDLAAIVVPTGSGRTARLISAFGPRVPVLAVSSQLATVRRMNLLFGVRAVQAEPWESLRQLLDDCADAGPRGRLREIRRPDRGHRRAAEPGAGNEPFRGPPGSLAPAARAIDRRMEMLTLPQHRPSLRYKEAWDGDHRDLGGAGGLCSRSRRASARSRSRPRGRPPPTRRPGCTQTNAATPARRATEWTCYSHPTSVSGYEVKRGVVSHPEARGRRGQHHPDGGRRRRRQRAGADQPPDAAPHRLLQRRARQERLRLRRQRALLRRRRGAPEDELPRRLRVQARHHRQLVRGLHVHEPPRPDRQGLDQVLVHGRSGSADPLDALLLARRRQLRLRPDLQRARASSSPAPNCAKLRKAAKKKDTKKARAQGQELREEGQDASARRCRRRPATSVSKDVKSKHDGWIVAGARPRPRRRQGAEPDQADVPGQPRGRPSRSRPGATPTTPSTTSSRSCTSRARSA